MTRYPITQADEAPATRPTFRDSQVAFEDAIRAGALSDDPVSPIFAGHFMYMYSDGPVDSFKHRDTRKYLHVRHG